MLSFFYKGINSNGHEVSNVILATSKSDALYQLMELEIDIISIQKAVKIRNFNTKLSLSQKDMISFFIHISEMAHAGINTLQSLDLLIDLSNSKDLLRAAKAIKTKVQEGANLSDAMTSIGCFGEMFPNLIFVAEKTNSVEKIGIMIVDYIKWAAKIKQHIRSAILKPIIGLVFILLMIVSASTMVLPKLIETLSQLSQGKLPTVTENFISFSHFLLKYWPYIPIFIIFIFLTNTLPKLLNWKKGAIFVDKVKLKIPLFGQLLLKIEIARLSAFISILIHSGYKVNEAIMMSPRVIMNRYIRTQVEYVGIIMSSGDTLHSSFSKFKIFPKFFISMIGIGEAVNDVEGTIMNIKETYDKEVINTAEFVINSMKPIMTMFTGLIVGWMGVAIFSPMYSSITNISTGLK